MLRSNLIIWYPQGGSGRSLLEAILSLWTSHSRKQWHCLRGTGHVGR